MRWAVTSTIYTFVASSEGIKAYFVHSRGCLSPKSYPTMPELPTSWFSISQIVRTNALVDHGHFPVRAAINWVCSSWHILAACATVYWRPLTTVWINSHPTACCSLLMLLPVLRTSFKCVSWVIYLVAALAELRWCNWCLRSYCVPISDVFHDVPANWLDLDPYRPGWGGCVSMICWCGIGEEDDNEKKWEVLRFI